MDEKNDDRTVRMSPDDLPSVDPGATRLMGGDVETKTVRCALTCSRQADGSWAWDELPGSNQAFVAALSGVELPD